MHDNLPLEIWFHYGFAIRSVALLVILYLSKCMVGHIFCVMEDMVSGIWGLNGRHNALVYSSFLFLFKCCYGGNSKSCI